MGKALVSDFGLTQVMIAKQRLLPGIPDISIFLEYPVFRDKYVLIRYLHKFIMETQRGIARILVNLDIFRVNT